jgi:hypothetical protein
MKRVTNEFSHNDLKRIKNDDDFLFQGNDEDEDLIAHLVDIEPVVFRQRQTIPNPPMGNESDEFSDDLDDAAFKELQVQESEFLRQTQIMDVSPLNSYRNLPSIANTSDHAFYQNSQSNRWKEDFLKVNMAVMISLK